MASTSLYLNILQPLQQFHESIRLPVSIPLLSNLMTLLAYLAICSIFPNAFGWTLVILCFMSPSFQTLLFEAWKHKDGVALFNSCCWDVQSFFGVLFGTVYGGTAFILWPLCRLFRVHVNTALLCLICIIPVFVGAIYVWVIFDYFNTMMLRATVVIPMMIVVAVVSRSLGQRNR